jgi:hypothetical protein
MPNKFDIPDTKEVSRMFTFLLGRDVKVAKGSRIRTGARDHWTLGVYVGDDNSVVGVCATDIPLAVYSGAALSLFPPHVAKNCIDQNQVEQSIWENTLEVYNVVSRFFHEAKTGMVQLGPSYKSGEDVPLEIKKFMRRSKDRIDLRINIAGYGSGSLALIG